MIVLCLVLSGKVHCQTTETIVTGIVKEAGNNEAIVGAVVYVPVIKKGVTTDADGKFRLNISLPTDTFTIRVSYPGYEQTSVKLNKRQLNQALTFFLMPLKLKEIEVIAKSATDAALKLEDARLGVETVTALQAKELPSFFGEADMLKVLQLKPGVQNGGEGNAGLYIRGGGADQNLFLMDDAIIYNPQHLYGFFSLFSPEAIDKVDLHKATFPAEFGGRLSSVLEFKMREGDKQKYHVGGGIGILSSRFTVEGPIKKDTASFLLSARRTYFDAFTRMVNKAQENRADFTPIPDYYFYDVNAKLNWQPSQKDRLSLTIYHGRDFFSTARDRFRFDFNWSNSLASLRWSHQYNRHLHAKLGLSVSDYTYYLTNAFDNFSYELQSGIRDLNLRYDWTFVAVPKHTINFGAQATYHVFTIGRTSASGSNEDLAFQLGQIKTAREGGLYVSDVFSLNDKWQFNIGLRGSTFSDPTAWYFGLEPRLAARYSINNWLSAKAGFSRMYQYSHLVSSSGVALPTDFWYPSTKQVLPQESDQYGAGLTASLFGGKYLFSTELFYKTQQNQIDIKDGGTLFPNNQLDTIFTRGKGWSYGLEVYLEKQVGKTTGWIGYTLSWAYRQFPDINGGRAFFPRYDRRHDVSIVVRHELNRRLVLTGTWVFGTGNAITLPQGRSLIQDLNGSVGAPPGFIVLPQVNERNWYRMEPNHRMDLSLVIKFFPKHGESDLTLSLYNVYNRANPYFIYFDNVYSGPNSTGYITGVQAKQVSLFPILPGVTYNFRY